MNLLSKLSTLFSSDGKDIPTKEPIGDTIGKQKSWDDVFLKGKAMNALQGNTIINPYSQSPWVYKAIRILSENIPQAPFKIYKDKQEYPESSQIVQLFSNPNEYQSYFEWMESIISFLNLTGEAFVYMNPSIGQRIGTRNLPAELWSLNPNMIQHVEKDGELAGWVYGKMPIEKDEIIHLKLFNPNVSSFRGLSPIESIRQIMEADAAAARWNNVFFQNDATPNGVITAAKDVPMDITTLRKLKKEWYSNHGGVNQSHKTAFLLAGLDYKNMSITQRDMEWIEGSKMNRESILAIFGIDSFNASLLSDGTVTRATALAEMRRLWETCLIPMMIRIEQKFKSKFFMRFFGDGTYGKFDTTDIPAFKSVLAEDISSAQTMFSLGYTRNEINHRLGLGMAEDDDDGDTRYLPMNLIPVGGDEGGVPEKAVKPVETKTPKPVNKVNKLSYERNFLKIQGEMEKKFYSKLKRYIFDLRKEVLRQLNTKFKALTADEEMELMALLNGLFDGQEMQRTFEPIYRETAQQAGDLAYNTLGFEKPFIINENILNARLNHLKGVNDTMFETIRSGVQEGIKEGQTIDSITETIEMITENVKLRFNRVANRARIVARTETASLVSAQTFDAYQKEGIRMKEWVTAGDEKVRDSHVRNGEQDPIPMTVAFDNGQMYPGDYIEGKIEESINCRCVLVPFVEV